MKARIEKAVQRRLIRDLLTYRMGLVIIVLTTLVQVALTVYFPVLIGQAVDSLLSPNRLALLVPILLKMLVTMLANAVMQWLSPLLSNRLVYTYTSDLRNKINHHLNHLPIASIDRFGVGDLVSRITTDLEQLSNGLLMVFNQFFLGIVMIIVTLVTMSSLDIIMVTLVLVLTPLSLVLSRFIAQKSYLYFQEQTQSRGQQTQFIEEAINQEIVVHLFNAQDQMQERFGDLNHRYAQHSQKAVFYSSTVNPATRFVNSLIYALLAGIGAFRIIQGGFTVGQLVTFLNYVNQYTKPFNDISSVMSELQSALACAERLYHLLDLPLEETSSSLVSLDNLSGHVTFEEVSFDYVPDKPLIQNLNLNIPAGSQVAIVGPTGAGKSTLINLLMRFYDSDSGRIYIDQTPIDDVDRQVLRQQMGMVLQETWLKSASVHDNIAYGKPDASRKEIILAAKAANAHFFIEQLPQGYDTFLEDGGASLSQGQRQLLTIARVILKSPKILILDEATSSIDTRTESLIQDAFNTLMTGRTSFIIAHRLSTIRNANMILVMVDGDIVEYGNHEQLMSQKGFYYKMQRQGD
ncbi:ABC transporter, ATP-binding/permease protein [Streptococcus acidominimus]|uniref:ABC transporter, ATP-binding/permease protein n=1 Tax=Streptococcus acidominimus TaxID=1326 RepID=A0A239X2G7_STRAI|nr:ABC transporter ATP-binding protein [Streptococcus acidominimus]SNV40606.1 ABC transporter, ATP-binding/permease protein [Streptococcus acidominimus]